MGSGAYLGAAFYAGKYVSKAQPASCPVKPTTTDANVDRLCVQSAAGYDFARFGKSFRSVNPSVKYTSYKVKRRSTLPVHVLQSRVDQGCKLRAMYRCLGWSRADCAKFLHITERCVHNWESGWHAIPFAAYRLLRIHCGMRLPGREWRGWSISRGKLCTPEGHELSPYDANWWSLLVRRAQVGSEALRQLHQIKRLAHGADALAGGAPLAGIPDSAAANLLASAHDDPKLAIFAQPPIRFNSL
ncbi:MAG: VC1465 family Xer recombination activation factor [Burkholderiaceae bacterium]|nr:VC1465 family Xer recombination activation factor [Burkholderiaceae bacterium]